MNTFRAKNGYGLTQVKLAEIQERIENCSSVYRGKDGRCCCGCFGIHRYTKASAQSEGKKRGYPVTGSDINDSYVKKIRKIILDNIEIADVRDSYIAVVLNGILYIAYDARN